MPQVKLRLILFPAQAVRQGDCHTATHPQGAAEHYVITAQAWRWRDQKFSPKCLSASQVFPLHVSD